MGGVTERARATLDRKELKAFQRNEKDAHAFHETMKSLKFARPDVIDRELATPRPKRAPGISPGNNGTSRCLSAARSKC